MRAAKGALAVWLVFWAGHVAAAEVVVHPEQPQNSVSRAYLRGVFGMRVRAWPDGTPVHVVVLPDTHPLHVEFCTQVLQMYPYQLRQNWDRLVFSGTGQRPIEVATPEELIARVAATPGAIGYIPDRNVKILNVR